MEARPINPFTTEGANVPAFIRTADLVQEAFGEDGLCVYCGHRLALSHIITYLDFELMDAETDTLHINNLQCTVCKDGHTITCWKRPGAEE